MKRRLMGRNIVKLLKSTTIISVVAYTLQDVDARFSWLLLASLTVLVWLVVAGLTVLLDYLTDHDGH